MKRINNLWDTLVSFPHLLHSARKASRRKRRRDNVARFQFHLERELCRLQDELQAGTWRPGAFHTFRIADPVPRLISAAPYRDRVVHHALCGVLEPIWEKRFIHDSYACRKGKGTHAAVNQFVGFARWHNYALKCDIRKYFPSIDHEWLRAELACVIKDRRVLELADRVIAHTGAIEDVAAAFPDDPLFREPRRRGLPLGNQTSQFFANVFLDRFDHFVKQTLRVRHYIRYVDDFVIFGNHKPWLAEVREQCREFLERMRLRLHPEKSVILRTKDGVPFLGYRVFPTYRLLPRANATRMRRRLRGMAKAYAAGEMTAEQVEQRWASWLGHARHARTMALRGRLGEVWREAVLP